MEEKTLTRTQVEEAIKDMALYQMLHAVLLIGALCEKSGLSIETFNDMTKDSVSTCIHTDEIRHAIEEIRDDSFEKPTKTLKYHCERLQECIDVAERVGTDASMLKSLQAIALRGLADGHGEKSLTVCYKYL